MNKQEIQELKDSGFPQDWKLISFLVRDGMRKRGIRSIPITGYTALEKEIRDINGYLNSIQHQRRMA